MIEILKKGIKHPFYEHHPECWQDYFKNTVLLGMLGVYTFFGLSISALIIKPIYIELGNLFENNSKYKGIYVVDCKPIRFYEWYYNNYIEVMGIDKSIRYQDEDNDDFIIESYRVIDNNGKWSETKDSDLIKIAQKEFEYYIQEIEKQKNIQQR